MPDINIAKITLKDYLKERDIKLNKFQNTSYTTIRNMIRGYHDGAKYNKDYRGRLPYFPTETTISKLSLELGITYEELVKLVKNQHKFNKSLEKNKK